MAQPSAKTRLRSRSLAWEKAGKGREAAKPHEGAVQDRLAPREASMDQLPRITSSRSSSRWAPPKKEGGASIGRAAGTGRASRDGTSWEWAERAQARQAARAAFRGGIAQVLLKSTLEARRKTLTVSMFQAIVEIPGVSSIKDKRRVVHSLRDRIQRKFRVSCAEVDLNDSLAFCQLGAAIVSNSRSHGEGVMQKALCMIEDSGEVRVHDFQIHSETY